MNKIYILIFYIISTSIFAETLKNIQCPNCNLIIVSLSNARPKNMSIYGYQLPTTPNLENFFKNDFIFTNAMAPASLTFVDAISFFYSQQPIKHQIFSRKKIKQNYQSITKYETLTSLLKNANYNTAAFVSEEDYSFDWGMSKGFDLYFDKSKYADYGIVFKPQTYNIGIKNLTKPSIEWLKKNLKSKFFLFLQSFDMHCPYGPNDQFSTLYHSPHSQMIPFEHECFMNRNPLSPIKLKNTEYFKLNSFFAFRNNQIKEYLFTNNDLNYLRSRYDVELTKTDFYLNNFLQQLKSLGLEKNTVILVMSEHGDNLGENNFYMKSNTHAEGNLHNANINFALLLKIPGHKSKTRFHSQLIQTIDLAPTLLELLGVSKSKTMQGKSFLSVLNESNEINDSQFGYSLRYNFESVEDLAKSFNEIQYLQNHEWKYYREIQFDKKSNKKISEKNFLFNLYQDPNEKANLAKSNPQQLSVMLKAMEEKAKNYSK